VSNEMTFDYLDFTVDRPLIWNALRHDPLDLTQSTGHFLSRDSYCRGKMSIRPSVRPSHAGILSKRLNISSKFFSPSGRQTIPVCPYVTGWQCSDGDPLKGASNARGCEKITIFDQYLAITRK